MVINPIWAANLQLYSVKVKWETWNCFVLECTHQPFGISLRRENRHKQTWMNMLARKKKLASPGLANVRSPSLHGYTNSTPVHVEYCSVKFHILNWTKIPETSRRQYIHTVATVVLRPIHFIEQVKTCRADSWGPHASRQVCLPCIELHVVKLLVGEREVGNQSADACLTQFDRMYVK